MIDFTAADHVTEREVGSGWEDCTFASMLETMRLGLPEGRNIPATITEVNRFRAATGLPDAHTGITIEGCIPAAKRLYGLTDDDYTLTRDWVVLQPLLEDPDVAATITGWMGAVAALRKWDDFTGAHAVAKHGVRVWCDPLAPHGTYTGETVSSSLWRAFFTGLPGSQAFIMRTASGGQGMIAAGGITLTSNKQAIVLRDTDLLLDPGGKRIAGFPKGRSYPCMGTVPGHRVVLVTTPLPYADKMERPTYLYVRSVDVDVQPAVTSGVDTGPAVRAAWEAWVSQHPK